MSQILTGSAIITGAGSGIGQATSVALARHGIQKIALVDVNDAGLQTTTDLIREEHTDKTEVLIIVADVSDETSVAQAVRTAVKNFGRIDIALNIAGIPGPLKPSTDVSLEEFRKVIDVNMTGMWLCQREELRQMLLQEAVQVRPGVKSRGVIVNMASIFGLSGAAPYTPAAPYNTSKHGVMAITRNDANTYAKDDIRINAVCPGYIKTATMEAAVSQGGAMRREIEKVPMGRLANPEEVAEAIIFLASPMSSFMTGAALVVDGGYTAN